MSQTLTAPNAEAAGVSPPAGADLRRVGGMVAITGAVVMVGSAILMFSTGADMFAAVEDREMENYLADVTGHTGVLELHLLLWVFGAVSMSCAITLSPADEAPNGSNGSPRSSAATGPHGCNHPCHSADS